MVSLRSIVVLPLLCATVIAVGVRHPPHDENHLEHHDRHGHNKQHEYDIPIPAEEDNINIQEDITRFQYYQGLKPINFPLNGEDKKFYRPYIFRPYPFYPYHHHPEQGDQDDNVEGSSEGSDEDAQPFIAEGEEEEMEENKFDTIEELDDNASDSKEEQATKGLEKDNNSDEVILVANESRTKKESFEVPCDFITVPRYSCYSCYTYLVCKQSGGKVKACPDPYAPYCNDGLCAANPSAECQANMSTLFLS